MTEQPTASKRRVPRWAIALVCVVAILAAFAGGVAWYLSTPGFAEKVRLKLIAVLEDATGGRVELGEFHWSIRHLAFEVDNLTIHGLEAANEVPYAHVDRLFIQIKLFSLIHPKAGVRMLDVQHPVFHLIVYKDGTTNQPTPKTKSRSTTSGTVNTIFDLEADRASVENGWVLVNQQATPFALAASRLHALVEYRKHDDKYLAQLNVDDLTTKMDRQPMLHSQLSLHAIVSRGAVDIDQLNFNSAGSHLTGNAHLVDFNNPRISAALDGNLAVRDLGYIIDFPYLAGGDAEVHAKATMEGSNPVLDSTVKVRDLRYSADYLKIGGVRLNTDFHLDKTRLEASKVEGTLLGGSVRNGFFRLMNWQSLITEKRKEAQQHAEFGVDARGIDVRQVLRGVLAPQLSNVGINTAYTGRAEGGWIGNPANTTAGVRGSFVPLPGPGGVPAQGSVDARYDGAPMRVVVNQFALTTPASNIQAVGSLDVRRRNSDTSLKVDVTSKDLSEFDPVFSMAGLSGAKGKGPAESLPVQLHGEAHYAGRLYGPLDLLRVTGHLDVTNFDTLLAATPATPGAPLPVPQEFLWDALHTDVDVAWNHIAVSNLTLARGKTMVQGSAEITSVVGPAHPYTFGKDSPAKADLAVHNAQVAELLQLAGEKDIPVTGTLTLDVKAAGTMSQLQAAGHLQIIGGQAYGQPYKSLNADITGNHSEVGIANLVLLLDGGRVTANGGYDLIANTFHAGVVGANVHLGELQAIKGAAHSPAGTVQFNLNAHGTMKQPLVDGTLQVLNVSLDQRRLGDINAEIHTSEQSKTMVVNAKSTILNSNLEANAQVQLYGDYAAHGKVTLGGVDVSPLHDIFAPNAPQVKSDVEGVLTFDGPLAKPTQLHVDAVLPVFTATTGNFKLANDGPLKFSLDHGQVRIDQFLLRGPDSSITAHGTAGLFGSRDIAMKVDSEINLSLLRQFSPDVTSSGHTAVHLNATGTLDRPQLVGQVKFTNGNVEYLNLPNGVTNLNGTLNFNEDRLEVGDLSAQTGGGTVKLGGFLTYENGLYVNLTANAKNVRVRYPQGISSSADASLRLQGTPQAATLSGNVLITRFAIQGSLSAGSTGAASIAAPPDPGSLLSHVVMDVHVASSPQLSFENSYATLVGTVDLRVRGSLAAPSILGRINITQGNANFAGVDYTLQRGDIYFSNPVRIDPVIDLDAVAQVEDYDISLGLHGTIEKLNTTYRSSPPLPQQDIIALLALGRTQEEGQIYQQQQAEAGVNSTTNAILGGALNATVSNRVQKLFGVGQVKIDPNFVGSLGNSTARVTVTQQLSKQVTVTFATNVNETSQQLIQVQVAVNHDVSVLLNRDEAGVFNALVKIRQRRR